jgi:hypothetical protein
MPAKRQEWQEYADQALRELAEASSARASRVGEEHMRAAIVYAILAVAASIANYPDADLVPITRSGP